MRDQETHGPDRPGSRDNLKRIAVVGTSCSGKTTLARRLAGALGAAHIELDAIHWKPNWELPSIEEFRTLVTEAVSGERWVADGNYGRVRDVVWGRATHVVWLNYPFLTVLRRALARTLRRIVTQEKVCGDNRESFRASFLHRDGIPWWVVRTHHARQERYADALRSGGFPHLSVIELRNQREAEALIHKLEENT